MSFRVILHYPDEEWDVRQAEAVTQMRVIEDIEEATSLAAPVAGLPWALTSERTTVGEYLPTTGPDTAYLKLFHAVYEDPAYAGSTMTWDEAERAEIAEELAREAAAEEAEPPPPPSHLPPPRPHRRRRRQLEKMLQATTTVQRTGTLDLRDEITSWRRLPWQELLAPHPLTAATDWRTLGDTFATSSWPRAMHGPDEGSLDLAAIYAITRALGRVGSTDSVISLPWWWRGDPDHAVPGLGHVAAASSDQIANFTVEHGASPNRWWAADGSWHVYTEIDSCTTLVACSERLARLLHRSRILETLRISPEDTVIPEVRLPTPPG